MCPIDLQALVPGRVRPKAKVALMVGWCSLVSHTHHLLKQQASSRRVRSPARFRVRPFLWLSLLCTIISSSLFQQSSTFSLTCWLFLLFWMLYCCCVGSRLNDRSEQTAQLSVMKYRVKRRVNSNPCNPL